MVRVLAVLVVLTLSVPMTAAAQTPSAPSPAAPAPPPAPPAQAPPPASTAAPAIENGSMVQIEYTLSDDAGKVIDSNKDLDDNPSLLGNFELPGGLRDGRRWVYVFPAYHWFVFAHAAAAGQYDRAIEALNKIREASRVREKEESNIRNATGWLLGSEIGLSAPPAVFPNRLWTSRDRDRVTEKLFLVRLRVVQRQPRAPFDVGHERGAKLRVVGELRVIGGH